MAPCVSVYTAVRSRASLCLSKLPRALSFFLCAEASHGTALQVYAGGGGGAYIWNSVQGREENPIIPSSWGAAVD